MCIQAGHSGIYWIIGCVIAEVPNNENDQRIKCVLACGQRTMDESRKKANSDDGPTLKRVQFVSLRQNGDWTLHSIKRL